MQRAELLNVARSVLEADILSGGVMYRFCKSSPFTSSFLGQRKSDGYDVPAAHSSMSAYLEFSRFLIDILLVSFLLRGAKRAWRYSLASTVLTWLVVARFFAGHM